MNASDVPEQLDKARVLSVAPAKPGQIGHAYDTGVPVPIAYFAIAQYPNDAPRAYLFGVSGAHEVLSDTLWDSPEEAGRVALDSDLVTKDFEPRAGLTQRCS